MQRNKQVAMGRKKFNMDPKKVQWDGEQGWSPASGGVHGSTTSQSRLLGLGQSQQPGQGLVGAATDPPSISLAPLQGIQFLIENDLLKNTCEDIAQFLYKGEGLNKTAIGDYLGER